LKQTIKNKNK